MRSSFRASKDFKLKYFCTSFLIRYQAKGYYVILPPIARTATSVKSMICSSGSVCLQQNVFYFYKSYNLFICV
ncbi:hypothetical protein CS542_10570 [Pedobacter sp. IW39]|nr:hypothetical protein CS542_10570 [Pedobacter sp. IW39]